MTIKLFILAVLFVISGGAAFSEYFKGHKFISLLATAVAIIATFYLFQDIIDDLKQSSLPTQPLIVTEEITPPVPEVKFSSPVLVPEKSLKKAEIPPKPEPSSPVVVPKIEISPVNFTAYFQPKLDKLHELQNHRLADLQSQLKRQAKENKRLKEQLAELQSLPSRDKLAFSPPQPIKTPLPLGETKPKNSLAFTKLSKRLALLTSKVESISTPTTVISSPVADNTARKIAKLLKTCKFIFDNNWLTSGGSETALDCYKKVLKLNENSKAALQGLVNIENLYVKWAEKALKNKQKAKARQYLASLRKVNPKSPKLTVLESQLE